MKIATVLVVPAFAAALQLAACASTGGAAASSGTVATPAPPAVTAGDSKTLADVPYGFQLVVQKGEEYYCKREAITGSRTNTRDICLTKAQMEAQRNGTEDYLKRMRDSPVDNTQVDGSGGRYNSVLTQ
ncbi:MAG: hypothetical protein IT482_06620 [Gammaproteobacteria bacterium]|jgi:hypothetical protein|nr:hypothetical protein [Pseudomonadota bacterium]MCC6631726.1 hypothetical protein [Gammaproteobacteria bacterium]